MKGFNKIFFITGFSLAVWRIENDIGPTAFLYPVEIARLIKTLGIGNYRLDSPCSRHNGTYVPHSSGWNDSKSVQCHWCNGQIVDSSPGWVKPKTVKLVFVASSLSTQH